MNNFYKSLMLLLLSSAIITSPIFAAKLIMKSKDGAKWYRCTRPGMVGETRVKHIKGNTYEATKAPYKKGRFEATSVLDAARESCGENRGR